MAGARGGRAVANIGIWWFYRRGEHLAAGMLGEELGAPLERIFDEGRYSMENALKVGP